MNDANLAADFDPSVGQDGCQHATMPAHCVVATSAENFFHSRTGRTGLTDPYDHIADSQIHGPLASKWFEREQVDSRYHQISPQQCGFDGFGTDQGCDYREMLVLYQAQLSQATMAAVALETAAGDRQRTVQFNTGGASGRSDEDAFDTTRVRKLRTQTVDALRRIRSASVRRSHF